MDTQAYIYVTASEIAGRWDVQVIDGPTVYTPDTGLNAEEVKETIAEYKALFPGAIISYDE